VLTAAFAGFSFHPSFRIAEYQRKPRLFLFDQALHRLPTFCRSPAVSVRLLYSFRGFVAVSDLNTDRLIAGTAVRRHKTLLFMVAKKAASDVRCHI
jgi:hypothetical protein